MKLKKFLSIALMILLVLAVAPISASAATLESDDYSGSIVKTNFMGCFNEPYFTMC